MSTINFLYFLYNYNILELKLAFDSTGLGNHFFDKFQGLVKRKGSGTYALLETIMEMSDDNKQKVIEWVENNYKAFK